MTDVSEMHPRFPREALTPMTESAGGPFVAPATRGGQVVDWLVLQLADSAFPAGGFAHSSGLESAWQHGEAAGSADLVSFCGASLRQLGHGALPLMSAAHAAPGRLAELDRLCDAFTSNHVANRASRLQGGALLLAVERIFSSGTIPKSGDCSCGHFAPVFGAVTRALGLERETAVRLFFFLHLRGLLAAAVRLNIVGPMEAQSLQHRLTASAESVIQECRDLGPEDLAQTSPLVEIWQGSQDRLYSRLFQS
jgi:urease accessory protein